MDLFIPQRGPLQGEIKVPGDKSISHRALLIAALADGVSTIRGLSPAGDPTSTKSCLKQLGVQITEEHGRHIVFGKGLHGFQQSRTQLDCGNSGTTMRLLSGILAGQQFASLVTGDESLRRRPMNRIIDPLTAMGARIRGTLEGNAPLSIDPSDGLRAITYRMPMASAQVKSAILLAGIFAEGTTCVEETTPTRDHTERLLGIKPERWEKGQRLSVVGGRKIEARDYTIPGDPSSAAFLIAAAILIPGSELLIRDVGLNPTRIAFLGHLLELGAHIEIQSLHISSGEPFGNIFIRSSELQGNLRIEGEQTADVIDEIPILSVAALAAGCGGSVRNAQELRSKESDRIQILVKNIRALGAEVEEYEDGFAFEPTTHFVGTKIMSAMDHRIAMSFGVIGCIIPGISIEGAEHVSISYPQFWSAIGVNP